MSRPTRLALLGTLFAILLAACAPTTAAPTAPPPSSDAPPTRADTPPLLGTQVFPFDLEAETVQTVRQGDCLTLSLVAPIPGAYRCTVTAAESTTETSNETLTSTETTTETEVAEMGDIFDPCLTADDGQSILCGADPRQSTGFRLETASPLPQTSAAVSGVLDAEQLRNQSYISDAVPGGQVTLTDGSYQRGGVTVQLEGLANGDLDGDGVADAAVVLRSDTGGSTVYSLGLVVNRAGEAHSVAEQYLGEGVRLESLSIYNGTALVGLLSHAPGEPVGTTTMPVTLAYRLEDDRARIVNTALLIELEDGTFCTFSTGATLVLNNDRLNYTCDDGSALLGDLLPGTVWTARRARFAEASSEPRSITDTRLRYVWQAVQPPQGK